MEYVVNLTTDKRDHLRTLVALGELDNFKLMGVRNNYSDTFGFIKYSILEVLFRTCGRKTAISYKRRKVGFCIFERVNTSYAFMTI